MGFVVNVLQNTIVVDIAERMDIEVDDFRQVVKHGYYNKVVHKQIKRKSAPIYKFRSTFMERIFAKIFCLRYKIFI